MWSQQAEDGGWHSRTYGYLKSGQSLTPFVLEALLQVEAPPGDRVDRALAFIKNHALDPASDDYPNYSAALAVLAISRAQRPGWELDVAPVVEYLRAQQLTEQNGWRPEETAYGAWGMGGERRRPPNPGHVDLSMTRYVLQGLAAAGVPPGDPAFEKALVFVERCRNPDGGFIFSPVVVDANKAGLDGARYRSYGTATADGILALRAMGRSDGEAQQWLAAHHRRDRAAGFVGDAYQLWARGLRFYYAAASAEACGLPSDLEKTQRADGSWSNSESLVKEDDPLIATALAVRALVRRQYASPHQRPAAVGVGRLAGCVGWAGGPGAAGGDVAMACAGVIRAHPK
ncbi:MAG: terpene cyclase/mutase family protein [Acidobacteria bacterium]|nr:terpene cyclase/mutase family protein [Acidobacteriota bacterium]